MSYAMRSRLKRLILSLMVSVSTMLAAVPILALSRQEVIDRLESVPVFTLTDAEGAPLISTTEGQRSVTGVFLSQAEAQAFLARLRSENPQLPPLQVRPVSLATVYETAKQSQDELQFSLIPDPEQVALARQVPQQNGQDSNSFQGVPLFVARAEEDGGYLTINQDGQEIIPLFFERETLTSLLDRLQQSRPDLAAQITIEVLTLENLIQVLETSNNATLNQLVLIPPAESVEAVRSFTNRLEGQEGTPAPEFLRALDRALGTLNKPFGEGAQKPFGN